eukprot:7944718-Pyramimonas_sp.AAC.1
MSKIEKALIVRPLWGPTSYAHSEAEGADAHPGRVERSPPPVPLPLSAPPPPSGARRSAQRPCSAAPPSPPRVRPLAAPARAPPPPARPRHRAPRSAPLPRAPPPPCALPPPTPLPRRAARLLPAPWHAARPPACKGEDATLKDFRKKSVHLIQLHTATKINANGGNM